MHYYNSLTGADFKSGTLCIKQLLIQPLPPKFFIWESWFTDMPCSLSIGPSSLYQRWNLHVRHAMGRLTTTTTWTENKLSNHSWSAGNNNLLLLKPILHHNDNNVKGQNHHLQQESISSIIQILLVVRNEQTNLWGSSRTARNFLNTAEITDALSATLAEEGKNQRYRLVVQDLSLIPFPSQIQLVSESSIIVGMHGAGELQCIVIHSRIFFLGMCLG